ncbi:ABC transporter permease [Legionella sp. D16C41]|uniref:ABC transporter permease n=1 Tax=Legionella sp. D16C41 TaxID=3402688 RepID=UPI003AF8C0E2
MKNFNTSLREMFASLYRNRELILVLIKREIGTRYRGSVLGMIWSFLYPIIMLAIYTFVFSIVFKARWNTGSDSKTEFALVLFAGLMVFNLFSDCINRASTLILTNANYVKKIVFPLEILPWVTLGAALFQAFVSFLVWLAFYLVFFGTPNPTIFFLPLIILPILFITMGLNWFIASLGVFLRDVSQLVAIITTVLMFLSPIFYPLSALPVNYRYLLQFNPLTPAIEGVRSVLFWGNIPNIKLYGIYLLVSLAFSWIGFIWFQKTRKGFADVL